MDNEKSNPLVGKNDNKVIRMSRYVAPADFVFKIQSFSSLVGWSTKRIQSGTFESGGFKWRLFIFLSGGNKKENVGEYISLYLSIADIDKLPNGWEVNVNVKFFFFNQIKNKYISIQDGKVWRFHCLRSEWGIEKLLALSSFSDPSNGYLVGDSCAFGAEVYVIKPNNATFDSVDLSRTLIPIYTWKIENYNQCEIKDTKLSSPEFIRGGWKWRLDFYPNGHGRGVGKSISLFLRSVSVECLNVPEVKASYKLRIKDQVSGGSEERHVLLDHHKFCPDKDDWGFIEFMSLTDLKKKSNKYVHDDSLVVEVEFLYFSIIPAIIEDMSDN